MSWIEKLKELNKKQEAEDIEYWRGHPKAWKRLFAAFIAAYASAFIIFVFIGAIIFAIIIVVFSIWFAKEMIDQYKKAFPKIDQAFTGLV